MFASHVASSWFLPSLPSRLPDGHCVVFVQFDENGRPLEDFRIMLHANPSGSRWAAGVAVTLDGSIYVTDDAHGRILKIEPHGPKIRCWPSESV